MKAEKRIGVWRPEANTNCLYLKNGAAVTVATAGMSLPNFICSLDHARTKWMYLFAIAAAVSAVILALVPRSRMHRVSKIPVFLYACYYVTLSGITFIQIQEANTVMISSLFLNALKLSAGITIIVQLFFRKQYGMQKSPLYWDLVKGTAFAGAAVDFAQFIRVFVTLDGSVLLKECLAAIMLRMVGEFWFAFVIVIAMHPQYASLNFRKLKRIIRDYIKTACWMAVISAIILLVVLKKIDIPLLVYMMSMLSTMIVFAITLHRNEVAGDKWRKKKGKNYVKEFCACKWAYSCYDIQAVVDAQRQLLLIERERRWIESMSPTEFLIQRLNQLDAAEWALQDKLFWRYSIHSAFQYMED